MIALQVPLRAVKVHQLLWNTCPSQKTSQQAAASITTLRNASRDSCGFVAESERIPRDRKLLRQQRFDGRNEPESIRDLCLKLNEAIEPDAPGLAAFRHLVQQARYAEALGAYRAYFFEKLRNPEKYGAPCQNLTGYQLKAGKKWVLKRVDP